MTVLFFIPDDGMEVEAFQRAKALPGRVVDIPQLGPRPYFDDVSPRNVTAIVGQSAVLHCRVKNLGQRTVSVDFLFLLGEINQGSPGMYYAVKQDVNILRGQLYPYGANRMPFNMWNCVINHS